jgi:hypothetical protein
VGVVKLRGVGVYLFGSSVWQVQLSLRREKTVDQTCRCRCTSDSLLAYRLKIHLPKTVHCTINCKRRWHLLKKNIHKGDNCVNDWKSLNGCDMFKVKQMIVVYDAFFWGYCLWRFFFFLKRWTAVWGYDMLVYRSLYPVQPKSQHWWNWAQNVERLWERDRFKTTRDMFYFYRLAKCLGCWIRRFKKAGILSRRKGTSNYTHFFLQNFIIKLFITF